MVKNCYKGNCQKCIRLATYLIQIVTVFNQTQVLPFSDILHILNLLCPEQEVYSSAAWFKKEQFRKEQKHEKHNNIKIRKKKYFDLFHKYHLNINPILVCKFVIMLDLAGQGHIAVQ